MRVVLNGLAALKPKTGVGHHVADLFAAPPTTFVTRQVAAVGPAAS